MTTSFSFADTTRGIDQRFIDECVDEEISMGDFVVTGGEIPAMALADAVCRMVPGVLPDEECFTEESHWNGLLSIPSIPAPTSGMGAGCRTCCSPVTTATWRNGGASRATSARCCAVPTCGRSLTRACAKPRASARLLAEAKAEAEALRTGAGAFTCR